jgi:hypothetical protein
MTDQLLKILSEINGKEHVDKIFFKRNTVQLLEMNYSLLEIYNLPETEFSKFNKITRDLIVEFKIKVENEPHFFEYYYNYILNTPKEICKVLNPNKSIAFHLLESLTEISDFLKFKSELPVQFFDKSEFNTFLPLSSYINDYFGLSGNEPLSLKEIGLKFGKSSEIIRVSLFENRKRADLRDLFLNGKQDFGLEVNKILLSYISKTFEECIYGSNFINRFANDDEIDIEIIKKLVEMFNFEYIEVSFEDSVDNYSTIVKKKETLLYRGHIIVIDSLFREGESYSKNGLIKAFEGAVPNLKDTRNNRPIIENGINNEILYKLLNDYFKIEIIKEDDGEFYQFKWQYLSSVNAKVTRILYENGHSMHKNEILEEYNLRANDSEIEIITNVSQLFIKKTDKIKPIGKSGYWFYSEDENDDITETIESFIHNAIINEFNGKVTFDQIKEHIQSTPYSTYPDNSIRANVLLCCRRTVDDTNLFIHQDFIEKYSEIKVFEKRNRYLGNTIINKIVNILRASKDCYKERKDLENEVMDLLNEEGITLLKGSNHAYLDKFIGLGIIVEVSLNDKIYCAINEEELKNYDLEKLGKKAEPEYKKNIRAHAISFLKERKKAKLSEIKAEVKHYIPNTIADNIFYKIFQDKDIFIKEQIGNDTFISLETSLLPVPQELHVEVVEESTELLGNTAVTERARYNLAKLKSEIVIELSSEVNFYKMTKEVLSESFDVFYASFSDSMGNISRWGDSLLQSLYELLCTKTDYYDRETCLNKLITGYETYLKSFVPINESKMFSGQAEVIDYFDAMAELRSYKRIDKQYRTDAQKTTFSYILDKIKYLSDISRHDKNHESLEMGMNKQIKNAIDFIALYLYTASLIKSV